MINVGIYAALLEQFVAAIVAGTLVLATPDSQSCAVGHSESPDAVPQS